ncbi:hypothetical protein ACHAW6_010917 [Cyclotella cf. meneghiniana]
MTNHRIFKTISLVINFVISIAASTTEISTETASAIHDVNSYISPIDLDHHARTHEGVLSNTEPIRRLRRNHSRHANNPSSGKPRSHPAPRNNRRRHTRERHHAAKATLAPTPTPASVSTSVGYGTLSPTPAPAVFAPETPAPVSEETGESSGGGTTSKGGPIGVSVNVGGNGNVVTTKVEIIQGHGSITHSGADKGENEDSNEDEDVIDDKEPIDDTIVDEEPADDSAIDDGWDDYDDYYLGSVSMSYGDTEGTNTDQYATAVDDNYDDYQGSVSMSYGDTEGTDTDQYATAVDDNYDDYQGSVSMSYGDTEGSNNDQYATAVNDNYDDYQGSVSMSYGDTDDSTDDQTYATFVNDNDDIGDGSISTSMSMSQSLYYDDGIVDDDMMHYIATEPTTAYEPKK